jgi:AcrR family transcriptional regulator
MKRLKQIEETKSMICDAFIKLLQDGTMDKITISQIAAEANIGRNTFYNHFRKKEDVLIYLMQVLLDELNAKLVNMENPTLRDSLLWRFTLIKENPLLTVFQKQRDIKELLFQFRETNIPRHYSPSEKDIYETEFIQGGIDYVTTRWIFSGTKESPEEMVDRILSLLPYRCTD